MIRNFSKVPPKVYCALILLGVLYFSFFHHIPQDSGDYATTAGITSMLINQALSEGRSAKDLFEETERKATGPYLSAGVFSFLGFGTPLWQFLLCIAFVLGGISHLSAFLLSSLISALSVWMTYLLGKILYSRTVGFIAALGLGTSLFFVAITRSVTGILQLSTLSVLLVLYFFVLAHLRQRRVYLWIAGAWMSLAFFNGYSQVFMVAPIVAMFWLWQSKSRKGMGGFWHTLILGSKDRRIFDLFSYIGMGMITLGGFVVLTEFWDVFLGVESWTTLEAIYETRATNVGFFQGSDLLDEIGKCSDLFSTNVLGHGCRIQSSGSSY